jgi:formate hydrogenlyase subunit 3/multisubunit Na+/H+ antiporter MnhD subunit
MNHAIMKGLLFLCSGAIMYVAGTRDLRELVGVGHKMPVTAVILTVGALAISGVPPFNGFISELAILLATLNAGMTIFAGIMLANILIGFAYYLRLLYILIWQSPKENLEGVREAPFSMLLPMAILMILCIVIGVWPQPFISFAFKAAEAVMNFQVYTSVV